MALSKKDILECTDRKVEKVSVPEWGGELFVRSMTGHERAEWSRKCEGCYVQGVLVDWSSLQTRLLISTVCDAEGKLLFEDKDAPVLAQRNAAVLSRVFTAASKLNGLMSAEVDAAKKNS